MRGRSGYSGRSRLSLKLLIVLTKPTSSGSGGSNEDEVGSASNQACFTSKQEMALFNSAPSRLRSRAACCTALLAFSVSLLTIAIRSGLADTSFAVTDCCSTAAAMLVASRTIDPRRLVEHDSKATGIFVSLL